MPEEGIVLRDKSEFMRPEEIVEIAKIFVSMGVKKIRLTGGEPLLRKGADHVIRELGKLPIELTMTTNGVLVDRYIEVIKSAGINSINVSLDSLKRDRFEQITRRDQFERVIDNIKLLKDEGLKVKVNVVLMKGVNDDEIINLIDWGEKNDLSIRFIEFMPFDGNQWNIEKKVTEEEILGVVKEEYPEKSLVALPIGKNATAREYLLEGRGKSFGIISTVSNPFCDSCNRIRLTADGKIKNCLFSQSETDLLATLRAGENIRSQIIETIMGKEKSRGGYDAFDNATAEKMENRSMVTIGG
jgi:cyclic pyranopterin phosphate synthase